MFARMGVKRENLPENLSEMQIAVLGHRTENKEVTEKQSAAQRKRFEDPRERRKLSDAGKGRPHTEEHSHKISESLNGHSISEITRKKIGDKARIRFEDPKYRKRIGDANSVRVWSKESRQKQRKLHSGENCHLWKGGISFEPYCVKFNREFKERVRAFFGYQCQECGHVWHKGESRLAVHHVNFRKDSCCAEDAAPLFVPLCSGSCHAKTQGNRPFWEYWFTEMINRLYGGKCYFTKEEMDL